MHKCNDRRNKLFDALTFIEKKNEQKGCCEQVFHKSLATKWHKW